MVFNRKRKDNRSPSFILDDSPKRTKVQAQRKFAQGSNVNSPVLTPVKEIECQERTMPEPVELLPMKRPNTEDFLTFLCFRGTPVLPPGLNFFNSASMVDSRPRSADSPSTSPKNGLIFPSAISKTQGERPFIAFGVRKRADPIVVSRHMDKKRRHALALQALRRKYQEQKMAKIRAITISKLSEKVQTNKTVVRTTRSITKSDHTVTKKSMASKTKITVVSTKRVKVTTRRTSTLKQARGKINVKVNVNKQKQKMCLRSYRGRFVQRELVNKPVKKRTVKQSKNGKDEDGDEEEMEEEEEEFSSDDDEPLLKKAVKTKKIVNKKPSEKSYRLTRSNQILTRRLPKAQARILVRSAATNLKSPPNSPRLRSQLKRKLKIVKQEVVKLVPLKKKHLITKKVDLKRKVLRGGKLREVEIKKTTTSDNKNSEEKTEEKRITRDAQRKIDNDEDDKKKCEDEKSKLEEDKKGKTTKVEDDKKKITKKITRVEVKVTKTGDGQSPDSGKRDAKKKAQPVKKLNASATKNKLLNSKEEKMKCDSSSEEEEGEHETKTGEEKKKIPAKNKKAIDEDEKKVTAKNKKIVEEDEKKVTVKNKKIVEDDGKKVTASNKKIVEEEEKKVTTKNKKIVDKDEKKVTAENKKIINGDKENEKKNATTKNKKEIAEENKKIYAKNKKSIDVNEDEEDETKKGTEKESEKKNATAKSKKVNAEESKKINVKNKKSINVNKAEEDEKKETENEKNKITAKSKKLVNEGEQNEKKKTTAKNNKLVNEDEDNQKKKVTAKSNKLSNKVDEDEKKKETEQKKITAKSKKTVNEDEENEKKKTIAKRNKVVNEDEEDEKKKVPPKSNKPGNADKEDGKKKVTAKNHKLVNEDENEKKKVTTKSKKSLSEDENDDNETKKVTTRNKNEEKKSTEETKKKTIAAKSKSKNFIEENEKNKSVEDGGNEEENGGKKVSTKSKNSLNVEEVVLKKKFPVKGRKGKVIEDAQAKKSSSIKANKTEPLKKIEDVEKGRTSRRSSQAVFEAIEETKKSARIKNSNKSRDDGKTREDSEKTRKSSEDQSKVIDEETFEDARKLKSQPKKKIEENIKFEGQVKKIKDLEEIKPNKQSQEIIDDIEKMKCGDRLKKKMQDYDETKSDDYPKKTDDYDEKKSEDQPKKIDDCKEIKSEDQSKKKTKEIKSTDQSNKVKESEKIEKFANEEDIKAIEETHKEGTNKSKISFQYKNIEDKETKKYVNLEDAESSNIASKDPAYFLFEDINPNVSENLLKDSEKKGLLLNVDEKKQIENQSDEIKNANVGIKKVKTYSNTRLKKNTAKQIEEVSNETLEEQNACSGSNLKKNNEENLRKIEVSEEFSKEIEDGKEISKKSGGSEEFSKKIMDGEVFTKKTEADGSLTKIKDIVEGAPNDALKKILDLSKFEVDLKKPGDFTLKIDHSAKTFEVDGRLATMYGGSDSEHDSDDEDTALKICSDEELEDKQAIVEDTKRKGGKAVAEFEEKMGKFEEIKNISWEEKKEKIRVIEHNMKVPTKYEENIRGEVKYPDENVLKKKPNDDPITIKKDNYSNLNLSSLNFKSTDGSPFDLKITNVFPSNLKIMNVLSSVNALPSNLNVSSLNLKNTDESFSNLMVPLNMKNMGGFSSNSNNMDRLSSNLKTTQLKHVDETSTNLLSSNLKNAEEPSNLKNTCISSNLQRSCMPPNLRNTCVSSNQNAQSLNPSSIINQPIILPFSIPNEDLFSSDFNDLNSDVDFDFESMNNVRRSEDFQVMNKGYKVEEMYLRTKKSFQPAEEGTMKSEVESSDISLQKAYGSQMNIEALTLKKNDIEASQLKKYDIRGSEMKNYGIGASRIKNDDIEASLMKKGDIEASSMKKSNAGASLMNTIVDANVSPINITKNIDIILTKNFDSDASSMKKTYGVGAPSLNKIDVYTSQMKKIDIANAALISRRNSEASSVNKIHSDAALMNKIDCFDDSSLQKVDSYVSPITNIDSHVSRLKNIDSYGASMKNIDSYVSSIKNIDSYHASVKNIDSYASSIKNIDVYASSMKSIDDTGASSINRRNIDASMTIKKLDFDSSLIKKPDCIASSSFRDIDASATKNIDSYASTMKNFNTYAASMKNVDSYSSSVKNSDSYASSMKNLVSQASSMKTIEASTIKKVGLSSSPTKKLDAGALLLKRAEVEASLMERLQMRDLLKEGNPEDCVSKTRGEAKRMESSCFENLRINLGDEVTKSNAEDLKSNLQNTDKVVEGIKKPDVDNSNFSTENVNKTLIDVTLERGNIRKMKTSLGEDVKGNIGNMKTSFNEDVKSNVGKMTTSVGEDGKSNIEKIKTSVGEDLRSNTGKMKTFVGEDVKINIGKIKTSVVDYLTTNIGKIKTYVGEDIKSNIGKIKTYVDEDIKSNIGNIKTFVGEDLKINIGKMKTSIGKDVISNIGKMNTYVSQDVKSSNRKIETYVTQDMMNSIGKIETSVCEDVESNIGKIKTSVGEDMRRNMKSQVVENVTNVKNCFEGLKMSVGDSKVINPKEAFEDESNADEEESKRKSLKEIESLRLDAMISEMAKELAAQDAQTGPRLPLQKQKKILKKAKPVQDLPKRPTRKTKEAAAVYMEILGHKLENEDPDDVSIDSFPELPNVKKMEQRENELKASLLQKKNAKMALNSDESQVKTPRENEPKAGLLQKKRDKKKNARTAATSDSDESFTAEIKTPPEKMTRQTRKTSPKLYKSFSDTDSETDLIPIKQAVAKRKSDGDSGGKKKKKARLEGEEENFDQSGKKKAGVGEEEHLDESGKKKKMTKLEEDIKSLEGVAKKKLTKSENQEDMFDRFGRKKKNAKIEEILDESAKNKKITLELKVESIDGALKNKKRAKVKDEEESYTDEDEFKKNLIESEKKKKRLGDDFNVENSGTNEKLLENQNESNSTGKKKTKLEEDEEPNSREKKKTKLEDQEMSDESDTGVLQDVALKKKTKKKVKLSGRESSEESDAEMLEKKGSKKKQQKPAKKTRLEGDHESFGESDEEPLVKLKMKKNPSEETGKQKRECTKKPQNYLPLFSSSEDEEKYFHGFVKCESPLKPPKIMKREDPIDLLSTKDLGRRYGKEKVNMSNEQIEKWLNDSVLAGMSLIKKENDEMLKFGEKIPTETSLENVSLINTDGLKNSLLLLPTSSSSTKIESNKDKMISSPSVTPEKYVSISPLRPFPKTIFRKEKSEPLKNVNAFSVCNESSVYAFEADNEDSVNTPFRRPSRRPSSTATSRSEDDLGLGRGDQDQKNNKFRHPNVMCNNKSGGKDASSLNISTDESNNSGSLTQKSGIKFMEKPNKPLAASTPMCPPTQTTLQKAKENRSSARSCSKSIDRASDAASEDFKYKIPSSPSASSSSSAKLYKRNIKKQKTSENYTPVNVTEFPTTSDNISRIVEAPVFHPNDKEFVDPMEYIEKIRARAEKFGICRIVPPVNFKPECKVLDEMRFTAYNQYVNKMMHRWGPNFRELVAIRKYLATQSISLKQPPWIGGMEIDLPRLYQTVQTLGGLKEVIEKKKWPKVSELMKIPKSAQDRVTKLDDIYCKYLLPYDTLSPDERDKLFDSVETDWAKRESKNLLKAQQSGEGEVEEEGKSEEEESEDEDETDIECIVKGRSMALNTFFRIARNSMAMWFKNPEPEAQEVEEEFWKHVTTKKYHICVHSGSIDSGNWGYGFAVSKNSPFARHAWNLKVLTNNSGSILRSMGPVMGLTVPTLHVGMVFSGCCWYRDPHSLPWIEYLHTGANKIWYGIPDSMSEKFHSTLLNLVPNYCLNKSIWLPSDTVMLPPELLVDNGVSLTRTVQKPGEFVVIFPKAFTSNICTGYVVSESVFFAPPHWLNSAELIFDELKNSCEPSMFSYERLLLCVANDSRSDVNVLKRLVPAVAKLCEREKRQRSEVKGLGVVEEERLPIPDNKKKKKMHESEIEYACEDCRWNLFCSMVFDSQENGIYCLEHAINHLRTKTLEAEKCRLMFTYDVLELDVLVRNLNATIEAKMQKKSAGNRHYSLPTMVSL